MFDTLILKFMTIEKTARTINLDYRYVISVC